MKAKQIESTTDAFGSEIRAGDKVMYYTGDEATLKTGTVVRILDKSRESYGHKYVNHRVIITPDGRPLHEANVGNKLCKLMTTLEMDALRWIKYNHPMVYMETLQAFEDRLPK